VLDGEKGLENPRWQTDWRKPLPGMLVEAMKDAGVAPEETLFVGDREEDRQAASAAGCAFRWAKDFFQDEWRDCRQLSKL
jgi:D-glycero-D-manno-heptose 1,7-bisphosphate phosphatase